MPGIHAGVAHDRHGADCSMFMYKELMLTKRSVGAWSVPYFDDPGCCWVNFFSFVWMFSVDPTCHQYVWRHMKSSS